MKTIDSREFFAGHSALEEHRPFSGQLDLTYRCSLRCVHCYCKGSENNGKELTTGQWLDIIDQAGEQGCIHLTISGGDPLIRPDFLRIYDYARKKGFLITVFTTGHLLTAKLVSYLAVNPPFSLEVTVNGITAGTYESITGVPGSFKTGMKALRLLKSRRLPLVIKANCLQLNKDEIVGIKRFAEKFLGKPADGSYRFKYDPIVYPRLNGDPWPVTLRLSPEELEQLRRKDAQLWREYRRGAGSGVGKLPRPKKYLYQCDTWKRSFFVDPFGRLKFCQLTGSFSADLKKVSFKDGFYKVFPQAQKAVFKTASRCRDCSMRADCYICPARAELETGCPEAPVEYFCGLARSYA